MKINYLLIYLMTNLNLISIKLLIKYLNYFNYE